jgi:hypothetical protein
LDRLFHWDSRVDRLGGAASGAKNRQNKRLTQEYRGFAPVGRVEVSGSIRPESGEKSSHRVQAVTAAANTTASIAILAT